MGTQLVTKGSVDWGQVAVDAAVGGAIGAATFGAGNVVSKLRYADDVADVAKAANVVSDQRAIVSVGDAVGAACSFSAGTRVLLSNGDSKPIADVEVGDEVRANDPETGKDGARRVTHRWIHKDTLVTLETARGDIRTTEDHPFWNNTDRAWQEAQELDPGDELLSPDGTTTRVIGLRWSTATVDLAYNLTVDDIHTYYVLVDSRAILVHNTCGPNQYSVAFEMKIDPTDWGQSRPVHFNRANAALDEAMQADAAFAAAIDNLIPGASSRVSSVGGRKNPDGWTWHHASEPGVLQLVPKSQHRSSAYSELFHPGGVGGYWEWAIPSGAPPN